MTRPFAAGFVAGCGVLFALVLPSVAAAQTAIPTLIEADQTRPRRPLVLADGAADLHVGFGLSLSGDPTFSAADVMRLPIGADFGLDQHFEVGGLVDLALAPEVATAWTGRARLDLGLPHKILALGVLTTLPLGYLTRRLGPRGLPFAFEIPALRLEGTMAAVQAVVRWAYTIRGGRDLRAVEGDVAGIVRFGKSGFAHLDLGSALPDLKAANIPVFIGLGVGVAVTESFVAKVQVHSADMRATNAWEVLVTVVNTSFSKAESPVDPL
ncbi:MAG: hypothetical protein HY903_04110 [Deltaproteobacteria bacterium]|nr:hypothetical protein [Deltaproteobacteria bacterium]